MEKTTVNQGVPEITAPFPSDILLATLPAVIKTLRNQEVGYSGIAMFHTRGSNFRIVATDSYSLTVAHYDTKGVDYSFLDNVRLKKIHCKQLLLAAKSGHPLSLGVSSDRTHLIVQCGSNSDQFKLSPVHYPDYESVIPKTKTIIPFDVKTILNQIKAHTETRFKVKTVCLGDTSLTNERILIRRDYLVNALTSTKVKSGAFCPPREEGEALKFIVGAIETVITTMRL